MLFYHVSSYLKENQILMHTTKNNYEFCLLTENADISNYRKYNEFIEELQCKNVNKTGRDKFKWANEAVFEYVRKKYFPNKPSRIWGIYVTNSLKDAILFNNKYRNGKSNIFEIVIPDDIEIFKFNMELFTAADEQLRQANSLKNYNYCIELAHKYWQRNENENENQTEIIIDNEVTVGRKIDF